MNEQDILFENVYTDTLETLEELNRDLYAKSRKTMTWFFGASAVLLLAGVLVVDTIYFVSFLLALFFLFHSRSLYKRTAKQQMKAAQDFYDGVMPLQVIRVTADSLYYINGVQSFRIPLCKLSRVTGTKNGLVLRAGNFYQFYLNKNTFIKGTYQDFLLFLEKQCPQITGK